MAIQINSKENALIKFTALTPANFGMQWGTVAVDSPTQVDAQYELPYIPDSAIKGVFAAKQEIESSRTAIWGTTDNWDADQPVFGNPAKIIFGNAYLVAFPVRFEDGHRAFVIPIHHLLYFQTITGSEFIHSSLFQDLVKSLLNEDQSRKVAISLTEKFHFVSSVELSFLRDQISGENFALLQSIVRIIFGNIRENVLFVGPNTATQLWKRYDEKRVMIQINEKKVTQPGSLRKIELIPEESVFFSFVSNFSVGTFILPELIPAGAWEKSGFGWFQLSKVESSPTEDSAGTTSITYDVRCTPLLEKDVMKAMYFAITHANLPPNVAKKIKSTIHNFGFYWKRQGLEAALAFELAKAKPDKTTDSPEAFAHRWFLKQLLNLSTEPPQGKSKYPELKNEGTRLLKNPPIAPALTLTIENRLSWLRRFSELEF